MNSAIKAKLAEIEKYNRNYPRRSVLFKGQLRINAYEFPCKVVDISLSGAKIKLGLPLAAEAPVELTIHNYKRLSARIVWTKDGYIGLVFQTEPSLVRQTLGNLGKKLLSQSGV